MMILSQRRFHHDQSHGAGLSAHHLWRWRAESLFLLCQDDVGVRSSSSLKPMSSGEIIQYRSGLGIRLDKYAAQKTLQDLLDFNLDPIYVTGRPQEVKLANCPQTRRAKCSAIRRNIRSSRDFSKTSNTSRDEVRTIYVSSRPGDS